MDIEAIKRRLEAATSGPWEAIDDDTRAGGIYVQACPDRLRDDGRWICGEIDNGGDAQVNQSNGELIAHAPADITALLSARQTLIEALEPFARLSEEFLKYYEGDDDLAPFGMNNVKIRVRDLRRAVVAMREDDGH
jgi:hypothetical protein